MQQVETALLNALRCFLNGLGNRFVHTLSSVAAGSSGVHAYVLWFHNSTCWRAVRTCASGMCLTLGDLAAHCTSVLQLATLAPSFKMS